MECCLVVQSLAMDTMKSIAVVCGSRKFDGIFLTTKHIIDTLKVFGFSVKAYQAVDPGHGFSYDTSAVSGIFRGAYFPFVNVEMGFNRLLVYPPRIRMLAEDEILISDTSMVGSIKDLSRMTVRVQDMRPLSCYRDNYFTTLMFRLVIPRLRSAKRLIVDTEIVKSQLIERGISGDKIKVVNPVSNIAEDYGAAMRHIESSVDSIRLHRSIKCLYVATDRPYKNIDFYLKLAKRFSMNSGGSNFIFYLVSKLRPATQRSILELDIPNLIVVDNIESMEAVYSQCDILVFPSLFEGFGIPLVEAMSRGIPVVTSNIPPMCDIVSTWGLLCKPNDVEDWLEKILIFSDHGIYSKYAHLSLQRYARFDKENFKKSIGEAFND